MHAAVPLLLQAPISVSVAFWCTFVVQVGERVFMGKRQLEDAGFI